MAQRRTPAGQHNGNGTNGHQKPVETQAEMIVRVLEQAQQIGLDRWVALAEGAAGGAATAAAGGGVYSANQRGGLQGWGATSWPSAGSGAYAGVVPSSQDHNPKPIPEMEDISPDKPSLLNYGVAGTSFFGSIIQSDEYNPEFGWRAAVLKYEEMRRNDGQVRAIERVVTLPLLSAKWSIKPASDDPMDQEIASFVESCLFHDMEYTSLGGVRITQTWHDILRHILLCVSFGFSPMEKCYRIEDGWVKWSKWQPLLPRTVWRWWVDRDNTLDGIQQWAYKDYTYQFTNIPRGKLLLFSFGQEGDNYEGVSMFRSTWKHWYYKSNFEKLVAIGVERNGVIPPIIYVGPTASPGDVAAALKLEANLRTNEAMGAVLPHDWKLEYPRIYQNHAEATLPLMQYYDILMARSVLAQFINLGSSETGAYSLDKSQVQTFLMLEQSIADYVAGVITNDAIRQLVDYNYSGVAVYPELQCARLTAQNLASLADLMPALQLYLPPSPELTDYFSDMLGLPVPQQSQVESTNPTEQGTPGQQGGNGNGAGGAQGKMSPQAAAGVKGGGGSANAGSEDDTTPDYQSPGSGDSSYAEYAGDDEALLFREALLAAYGHDAVERGVTWQFAGHEVGYSQQRDAHGRWAPTGNTGHGEGEGGGGGGGGRASKGAHSGGGRARGSGSAKAEKAQTEKPPRQTRAGRKAEAEANAVAHYARRDQELGFKPGTSAALAKNGFGVWEHSTDHEGNRVYSITREDNLPFRGENTPNLGEATMRVVYRPEEVSRFADVVAAHPGTVTPRTRAGQSKLAAEREAHGNDHIARSYTREGFRSARDETAGMTTGAKAETAKAKATPEERYQAKRAELQRQIAEHTQEHARWIRTAQEHFGRDTNKSQEAAIHATSHGLARVEAEAKLARLDRQHAREQTAAAKAEKAPTETKAARTRRAQFEALSKGEQISPRGRTRGAASPMAEHPLDRLQTINRLPARPFDIGARTDAYALRAQYGDHQLHDALRAFSHEGLKNAAEDLGLKAGRNKEETISRIMEHVQRTPMEQIVAHYQGLVTRHSAYINAHPEARADALHAESIHERAARLQREGGLPREVTPQEAGHYGQHLQAQPGHGLEGREFDPAAPPDTHVLAALYGEHQLGAALSRYGHDILKETAAAEGVAPGRTRAETVSRIVSHVTEGRYSANFGGKGAEAGAAAKGGGGTTRGSSRAGGSSGKGKAPTTETARTTAQRGTGARALKSASEKAGRDEAAARDTAAELHLQGRHAEAVVNEHLAELHQEEKMRGEMAARSAASRGKGSDAARELDRRLLEQTRGRIAEERSRLEAARTSDNSATRGTSTREEMLRQAYRDAASGRAFWSQHFGSSTGHWRLYNADNEGFSTGGSSHAHWDSLVKSTFGGVDGFFRTSSRYGQEHPGEIPKFKKQIGFSEPDAMDIHAFLEGRS